MSSIREPSVVLPRRVVRQPTPGIVPGGDCGACVLAGLLGLPDVRAAYDYKDPGDQQLTPFARGEMYSALHTALAQERVDRIVSAVPLFLPYAGADGMAFGAPGHMASLDWFYYMRMAFDAGYYGLAEVSHKREGVQVAETDHWVLLCGYREFSRPHETLEGASTIEEQILVSNSAKSAEPETWVEKSVLLRDWGGYNALLARPV
jgi:hypothetical protein